MTTEKDFKRLVRGRMQKTGESYTAARANLLRKPSPRTRPAAHHNGTAHLAAAVEAARTSSPPPGPAPSDYARLAGMSDKALKAKTGCTWEKWVRALDHVNAHAWPHPEIARYVREKYKVPDWWVQTVTVGYERIRGLRERGQRRSGTWETSKSRTVNAPVGKLFRAFKEPRQRTRWLDGARIVIRKANPNKSMRITWEDGTSVEVGFVSKGRSKSQVALQHSKLASRESADRMKAYWAERLEALAALLATSPT